MLNRVAEVRLPAWDKHATMKDWHDVNICMWLCLDMKKKNNPVYAIADNIAMHVLQTLQIFQKFRIGVFICDFLRWHTFCLFRVENFLVPKTAHFERGSTLFHRNYWFSFWNMYVGGSLLPDMNPFIFLSKSRTRAFLESFYVFPGCILRDASYVITGVNVLASLYLGMHINTRSANHFCSSPLFY